MKTIIDLHLHSHYSRATSHQLNIEGIAKFAAIKGVDIIATGDLVHPAWLKEIEEKLQEDGSGFLQLKDHSFKTQFALFGEISNIYKKNGKARRIHTVFGVSSLLAAKKISKKLASLGYNITHDGRPIIGADVVETAKIFLSIDPKTIIIPGHIWTPWFALFGSKSGFDTTAECFGEMSKYVYAIETGLSSDPAMNWRVSDLNNKTILSNSDAHSAEKIGREANVFNLPTRTYSALYGAIKENKNLEYTIEFYPEEGKYHLDGHRDCGVRFTPQETRKHHGICPKCGLPVVVGVMNRVEELADQTAKASKRKKIPFKSIVPLPEIIAECFAVKNIRSKKVQAEFFKLIEKIGNEFYILLEATEEELKKTAEPIVAEAIMRVRAGKLHIDPGYDGVFGTIKVFTEKERKKFQPQQQGLF
ncbi:MAG: hypothetical protein A2233_02580 [Candidatus Kerfeldbacteria bacterium RIFOXYA2_FULL_38_24]|uniref:DNA helicase UvrD n=1 Tax=Candidatus Kerfeldbacteria bacterium RIFOXYB2_FULL_38_14 TaxID=1798547 RepID=A0A1G2BEB8_9BACT|nr:MAG: hypothetical protein A2319_03160 [Candidatus Kerfeldbacteria bacterium RIFOXYB2_FULL_38_14]OGY88076.1 MAG: hypothetical protein A2233_02580 [Candidatus Kerfeldbacteria bacterium RIFOXYA2_FULL_38_24]